MPAEKCCICGYVIKKDNKSHFMTKTETPQGPAHQRCFDMYKSQWEARLKNWNDLAQPPI